MVKVTKTVILNQRVNKDNWVAYKAVAVDVVLFVCFVEFFFFSDEPGGIGSLDLICRKEGQMSGERESTVVHGGQQRLILAWSD